MTAKTEPSIGRLLAALTILLILIAYAPFLVSYLPPKVWSSGFTIY